MKYLVMAIVGLVAASCPVVYAFEVPVPELVGDYTYGSSERSVIVDLGGGVNEISSMSLELSGTVNSGWYEVIGETVLWGGGLTAVFAEPNPGSMRASTEDELNGPFVVTIDFYSLGGATWVFLLDGVGVLGFVFTSSSLVQQPDVLGPEPTCTIESAKLLVTGGAVAIEACSWSGVKALFRTSAH